MNKRIDTRISPATAKAHGLDARPDARPDQMESNPTPGEDEELERKRSSAQRRFLSALGSNPSMPPPSPRQPYASETGAPPPAAAPAAHATLPPAPPPPPPPPPPPAAAAAAPAAAPAPAPPPAPPPPPPPPPPAAATAAAAAAATAPLPTTTVASAADLLFLRPLRSRFPGWSCQMLSTEAIHGWTMASAESPTQPLWTGRDSPECAS